MEDKARRELLKLDKQIQNEIIRYLDDRVATSSDPHNASKALEGDLVGLWRYCVHDYRIVYRIEKTRVTIVVLKIAHRRKVYRKRR